MPKPAAARIYCDRGTAPPAGKAAASAVIFGYSSLYPPDDVERTLPDAAAARALLAERRPDILAFVQRRRSRLLAHFGAEQAELLDRTADAFVLGTARLGLRHGRFGNDQHAYHNEEHVLELAQRRFNAYESQLGLAALPLADWVVLALFAACHDLRQREPLDVPGPVDGNEAASMAEALRILDVCGFDRERDRPLYVALELAIAGSTFGLNARPLENSAEAAIGGGALARYLPGLLDQTVPDWRGDAVIEHALILARIAADLDTANAGESFAELADSAIRLCREREMRERRALDSHESAQPCLDFLTRGQEKFFFELHHFCSREGERVFGPGKAANAPHVRAVSAALREHFAATPPVSGAAVIEAYRVLAGC
ncbi:MAG: hypothetical protein JSR26_01065 [Proteobacteria bacterium]|nr:hypothetical protein [Pseudomonadota bacterium]